jgi:hypothetical protein
VAVLNVFNDFINHRVIYIKVNTSTGDLHCKKPQVYLLNTAVCNCWESLRLVLVIVRTGCI